MERQSTTPDRVTKSPPITNPEGHQVVRQGTLLHHLFWFNHSIPHLPSVQSLFVLCEPWWLCLQQAEESRRLRAEKLRLASLERGGQPPQQKRQMTRAKTKAQQGSLTQPAAPEMAGPVTETRCAGEPPLQNSMSSAAKGIPAGVTGQQHQQGQVDGCAKVAGGSNDPLSGSLPGHQRKVARRPGQVPDFRALHAAWSQRLANARSTVKRRLTVPKARPLFLLLSV
jgi:hypothetical protein